MAVDFRCSRPQHPFHRIVDCLLPYWGAIRDALNRTHNHSQPGTKPTVCLVSSPKQYSTGVDTYVAALLPTHRHQLAVVEPSKTVTSACTTRLLRLAALAAPRSMATPPPNDIWRQLTHDVERAVHHSGSINRTVALPVWRGRPASVPSTWNTAGPAAGHVLLISRGGSRAFPFDHEARLMDHLGRVTHRQVLRYTDGASALHTLRAFAGASAVVAYHGAGLVNAVFAVAPLCVIEISTLMKDEEDAGCTSAPASSTQNASAGVVSDPDAAATAAGRQPGGALTGHPSMNASQESISSPSPAVAPISVFQPWRTNRAAICPWNPLVHWNTYWLAMSTLLKANHVPCDNMNKAKAQTRDMLVKRLKCEQLYLSLTIDCGSACSQPMVA